MFQLKNVCGFVVLFGFAVCGTAHAKAPKTENKSYACRNQLSLETIEQYKLPINLCIMDQVDFAKGQRSAQVSDRCILMRLNSSAIKAYKPRDEKNGSCMNATVAKNGDMVTLKFPKESKAFEKIICRTEDWKSLQADLLKAKKVVPTLKIEESDACALTVANKRNKIESGMAVRKPLRPQDKSEQYQEVPEGPVAELLE